MMDTNIYIQNNNLARYVMFKLDKDDNGFTEEELNQITEVVINYDNENTSSFEFLKELLYLKKLERITLRNGYIYNSNYNVFLGLENLNEIVFEKCEFENADLISSLKLKALSLINCRINSYAFINVLENLEELTVINGKVDINKINLLTDLKHLQLSYSELSENTNININTLEELYIDNTRIKDFSFISSLTNLKKISIDEDQYNNNKELFNSLEQSGVIVMYENMVGFGGDDNEV